MEVPDVCHLTILCPQFKDGCMWAECTSANMPVKGRWFSVDLVGQAFLVRAALDRLIEVCEAKRLVKDGFTVLFSTGDKVYRLVPIGNGVVTVSGRGDGGLAITFGFNVNTVEVEDGFHGRT